MGEDSILPLKEVPKEKHLAPISDVQSKTSHLTPPSSPSSPSSPSFPISAATSRDVHFAVSNETLRDDFYASPTPNPNVARPETIYEVHCTPQPRRNPLDERDSCWRRAVQNFTPSYVTASWVIRSAIEANV